MGLKGSGCTASGPYVGVIFREYRGLNNKHQHDGRKKPETPKPKTHYCYPTVV